MPNSEAQPNQDTDQAEPTYNFKTDLKASLESQVTKVQQAKTYESPYAKIAHEMDVKLGEGSMNYPYVIRAEQNQHRIEFNGTVHTNDPTEPTLARLERQLDTFLSSADNPVIFIEGGLSEQALALDRETAIREVGEPGLVMRLQRSGVSKFNHLNPHENSRYRR